MKLSTSYAGEVSLPYMIGIYGYAVHRYHMQTSEVSFPYMIGIY